MSQGGANDQAALTEALTSLVNAMTKNARAMAENTRLLREAIQNNQQGNNTYVAFLKTNPPTFSKADDPLEADDWIRVMETKFELIQCSDVQKPLFAVQ